MDLWAYVTHMIKMSQIISKTIPQEFPQSYPPRICNQSWNQLRNKKSWKCTFCISKNFKHDWSANKYHQSSHKDFAKLPLKGIHNPLIKVQTFHNPSVHQNPLFSPFEPSSEVITHCMEHTWVKHTHPSNTPICTLQLSCNITKETYLSSCT